LDFAAMVGLVKGLDHCPTENSDGLAEKSIPSSLDKTEPGWKTRSSGLIKGFPEPIGGMGDHFLLFQGQGGAM
jgi:hypothetical protein